MFFKFLRKLKPPLFYGLILFGLYLTSLYSYNLFHSLAEIFSVVISVTVFILAWNSRQRLDNNYLLFLGIAYLFVGGIDLIHTLAYKGMGVFTGYDTNLSAQLWIASRYVQSLSLLIAPAFFRRKLNTDFVLLGYIVMTTLLLTAIFSGVFPVCFVEGVGLTSFKIVSEYIVCLILLTSAALLIQNREVFDRKVLNWLVASIILTISAELAFTFYISVYGFYNLVGHIFKIITFYLVYKALVETGLEKPHRLLFRDLKQNESALRSALEEVQRLAITDSLTGLFNRRHFFELSEREFHRARRYHHSLSVIMLDIDHFKRVNDTYSHFVGDQVLQGIAECCRQVLRNGDVLGRYGGEEFAIILPENNLSTTCKVAERIRLSIAHKGIDTTIGPLMVTASLGVTALDDECSTLETLLTRADQALYIAKQNGRNRVCSC